MNGATHLQILDALAAVAEGKKAADDAAEAAATLGLLANDELTPVGRRIVEEGMLKQRPDVTRTLLAGVLAERPESRVLLEGEWGQELSRDQAEKVLRYAHPPSRRWTPTEFTRIFDALNFAGLISYGRKNGRIRILTGPPSSSPPTVTAPISPATPYRNKRLLAEIVGGAKEHLYWFDAHFVRQGLDFIYQEASLDLLKSIQILSCGRSELSVATLDDYRRIRVELQLRGVALEWRTLLDRADFTDKHDRWLLADDDTWNIPPFTAILTGKWGTILRDSSAPPLDEWWQHGTELSGVAGS